MSTVKLKEDEECKYEPRSVGSRKQNFGSSRQPDMIAS
jgi:hypothetical protein